MTDRQEWHAVRPEGLAARILSVTIGFTVACLLVVGSRVWLRLRLSTFGTEYYLMCAGVTLNMVHNAVVMYGTFTGIGSPDSKLNTAIMIEGAKAIVLWQIFYVSGSLLIKTSICATLVRIATRRRFICTLYGLVAMSAVSTLIAILEVLVRCKPVAASWDPSLGSCLDQTIIITLTYVVSVINIINDFAVAIIPAFMLWDIHMRRRLEVLTIFILGLGILASTATIIRMPYSSAYSNPANLLRNVGNIILWTVVECGMGIIAGCLPMLRQLFKGLAKELSNKDDTYALRERSGTMALGHGRSRSNRESPPDTETDSTHGIIKTTRIDEGCSVMLADIELRPGAEATVAKYFKDSIDANGAYAIFHETDVSD
ncbi:hypothetical protein BDP55DRAFT_708625 [Colletotrichum godetiae]|uniref:Rhodopsin domain-containing protein n=1 Tax=Colletotrichum godetiae TaxID=1209918 RepID=A0AAJ0ELL1_9PEZI|nr:uncharacterized protein BDP55DRAFT_708625 [Colletotrichum godetiae]KAK1657675.1 hypothetical protein BDP55DRAFT_708625 [Colletotrichum godetiae]